VGLRENEKIVIGIDASRNRSGGAMAHLAGILDEGNPLQYGIYEIHIWTYSSLLNEIPNPPWLVKHNPKELDQSLSKQLLWQYFKLPQEAKKFDCDLLLNTDAGSICPFSPSVTMSRDLLSFEPGEMQRFSYSRKRLRLELLRFIQSRSLKKSYASIFLTRYAAKIIQKTTGPIHRYIIIPHGVGKNFRIPYIENDRKINQSKKIRILYVSNTSMYKHQWNVVKAVNQVRKSGFNLTLLLLGGGKGRAQKRLDQEIVNSDPFGEFVKQENYVDHEKIPSYLSKANIFVFASSCENMPNTLLEAMASGLPIACSDRGPMPEILKDGGVYFDPEKYISIASAIEKIIVNPKLREKISVRAREISAKYSWGKCADETWKFVSKCVLDVRSMSYKKKTFTRGYQT
jgi:glycosyltransferase involved in cell wall biosynthesis